LFVHHPNVSLSSSSSSSCIQGIDTVSNRGMGIMDAFVVAAVIIIVVAIRRREKAANNRITIIIIIVTTGGGGGGGGGGGSGSGSGSGSGHYVGNVLQGKVFNHNGLQYILMDTGDNELCQSLVIR